jgi:hypothetical protein
MAKRSEMEKTITIKYNLINGKPIYAEIDGKKCTEATHKLPLGALKGTIDLGEICIYELPDGTVTRSCHWRCWYI